MKNTNTYLPDRPTSKKTTAHECGVALFVPKSATPISYNPACITLNIFILREHIFQNIIKNNRNSELRLYKRWCAIRLAANSNPSLLRNFRSLSEWHTNGTLNQIVGVCRCLWLAARRHRAIGHTTYANPTIWFRFCGLYFCSKTSFSAKPPSNRNCV